MFDLSETQARTPLPWQGVDTRMIDTRSANLATDNQTAAKTTASVHQDAKAACNMALACATL
ncbi:MAG: hypothetical protein ACYS74_01900, partial [Planctomycetota bacterium]